MGVRQLHAERPVHKRPREDFLLIVHARDQENDIVTLVENARRLHYSVCVVDDRSHWMRLKPTWRWRRAIHAALKARCFVAGR
jgi:hypothetical protein